MGERTTEHLAREFAGEFYDFVRSSEGKVSVRWNGRTLQNIDTRAFAKSFPTVKDYLAGRRWGKIIHQKDGTVFWQDTGGYVHTLPGWLYFVGMAREAMIEMLKRPDVSEVMKERIFDAVIEDRGKQARMEELGIKPANVPQRKTIN